MRGIHYKRSGFLNPGITSYFYFPDIDLLLYQSQHGDREASHGFLCDCYSLNEAKLILDGIVPEITDITFFNKKEFEYDSPELQELVQQIGLQEKLQKSRDMGRINDLEKTVIDECQDILVKVK